jgi:hypothetical protein
MWQWLKDNWKNVLQDGMNLWLAYVKALPTIFMVVVKTIPRLLMVLGGALNLLWQKIWASDLPKWIWAGVSKIPTLLGMGLRFAFDVVRAAVAGIVQLLWEIPKALWEGLKIAGGLIKDMLVALATLDFEKMGEAIQVAMGTAINTAFDAAERVATAMGAGIEKAWEGAKDYGNTLVDDFDRAQRDPLGAAGKVLDDAGKEIAGAFAGFTAKTKGIDGLRFDQPMQAIAEATEEAAKQMNNAGTALGEMQEQAQKGVNLRFTATNLEAVMAGTADFFAMADRQRALLSGRTTTAGPTAPQGPRAPLVPTAPRAVDFMGTNGSMSTTQQLLERIAVAVEVAADEGPMQVTQMEDL